MKKEAKSSLENNQKQKALKISIEEGAASSFGNDLGNSLITPLATEIGASALHIGLINSFSGLVSPLAQIKGDRLMEKYSRKKIVTLNVLRQALTWLPIAAIGILYSLNIIRGYLPWVLIILYALLSNFGGLANAPWFSWMGDLVKKDERGKYFGKRNLYIGISSTVALILGGLILNYSKSIGFVFIGFGFLFVLSFLFRFISFIYLKKQYEPKFKLSKKSYFSFFAFIKRYDNFGKFAVYQAFFNFALMIASPFFAFYMLKNLGYENKYFLYMIVSLSSTFFYLVFTPLAGKFSDKYGNLRLMWISNICFTLNPILWIFVKTPLMIIFIPQLVSGIANAALSISVSNYVYDSTSREKAGICVAYTNLLIGIGTFLGSIVGGVLISYVSLSWASSFFFLFAIAAILRLSVALFFLPKIKEVKRVSRIRWHIPIHMHFSHPFKSAHIEPNTLGVHHHLESSQKNKDK